MRNLVSSPRLSLRRPPRAAALVVALVLGTGPLFGQTRVTPPNNRFSPEQDVEIGREAAAEVRKQYPVINDSTIQSYLDRLGRRLVEAAPQELRQPAFEYSFTAMNLKEINAFALPGGPMFINRGMVEAAETEGEVVGVMAHELAHVLLRHGTANATKAQRFQLGAIAGAIAGAVVGGGWGRVISEGSQFSLGTWLMKYSREYERQADLLGAQIMASAGYDPRDLARMFETIQSQSRGGAPEWMSSHPNPGNRTQYITKEAASLQIEGRSTDGREFERVRSRFSSLPPARSMADTARPSGGGSRAEGPPPSGRVGQAVPPPSTRYRTVQSGRLFQASVPTNWEAHSTNSSVKFVPENAYGELNGQEVFTHGVEFGVARASSRNLQDATATLVQAFARSNPDLRQAGQAQAVRLSQRSGIGTPLVNRSALGGQERIGLYTTFLSDGSLFYVITIAPERESGTYNQAFDRVTRSLRITDR